jgi:pSer/pThr/pTyr-binding forkhead associated (FHA) protein
MPDRRRDETTMPDNQTAARPRATERPVPEHARMSGVFQTGATTDSGWGFVLPQPDGTFDAVAAHNGAVVGSGPKADVRIAGDGVAPAHARVEVRADGVYLRDLDSPEGTFVCGMRAACIGVAHGDVVRFGRVLLVFIGRGLTAYDGRVDVDSPFVACPSNAAAFLSPAVAYAKQGLSFVIEGGPGIGKRALAQLAARKRAESGRVVTINAADMGPPSIVRLPATGAGTYIVVSADHFPRPAQGEIAQAVAGTGAIVIATLATSLDTAASGGVLAPAFAALFEGRRIGIPPLDQRREDVPGILWALARKLGIAPERLSVELIERLARASWPGGISEIEAALEHAASCTDGPLDECSVQQPLGRARSAVAPSPTQDDPALARERLTDAMTKAGGSIAAAARLLGMSRQSVYREAQRLGLDITKLRAVGKTS